MSSNRSDSNPPRKQAQEERVPTPEEQLQEARNNIQIILPTLQSITPDYPIHFMVNNQGDLALSIDKNLPLQTVNAFLDLDLSKDNANESLNPGNALAQPSTTFYFILDTNEMNLMIAKYAPLEPEDVQREKEKFTKAIDKAVDSDPKQIYKNENKLTELWRADSYYVKSLVHRHFIYNEQPARYGDIIRNKDKIIAALSGPQKELVQDFLLTSLHGNAELIDRLYATKIGDYLPERKRWAQGFVERHPEAQDVIYNKKPVGKSALLEGSFFESKNSSSSLNEIGSDNLQLNNNDKNDSDDIQLNNNDKNTPR